MSGFDWGVSQELLEQEDKAQVERENSFADFNAGVYDMVVDKAYLVKSKNGATGFEVELAEMKPDGTTGRHLWQTYWIKNREGSTTYTGQDGKQHLLPAWVQVNRLLRIAGKTLQDLAPKPVTIKRFGKDEEVGILEPLHGTKVKAVVRPYEDDYTGEVKLKPEVVDFLNVDGTSASEGGRDEEKWLTYLSKNPVKKLKKKAAQAAPKVDEAAKSAVAQW